MTGSWQQLGPADLVPVGGMRAFAARGRDILVCNTREGWFALDDVCTHADARMHEGRLRGCRLICPLHGGSFNLRDGRALGAPATAPLACYPLRLADATLEVFLPD